MLWDGEVSAGGERLTRAERVCKAACRGPKLCACPCHDAADRIKALLRERFGPGLVG